MTRQDDLLKVFRKGERLVREGAEVKEAFEYVGLARSTHYRRCRDYPRYVGGDARAFDLRSRAPKHPIRKPPAKVREEVVRLAQTGRFRFASEIAREVQRTYGHHRGTGASILEKIGLYGFRRDDQGRRVSRRREVASFHGYNA